MPVQTRPLDVFDVSVLGAGSHLWLSASSGQGSVYGVPRPMPTWPVPDGQTPTEWLSGAVRHAQREAGEMALSVGARLSDLVFGVPDIAALFQQARGAAGSAGEQLLLRVLVAPVEVSAWPWELLIDPQRPDQYLTLARDVHVVRAGRSRTYPVRSDPVEPPLNLLMVMSSPLKSASAEEETPFDLYEEKRSLLAELRPLEERGLLRVEVEDRPTVERLRSRIGRQRRGFHLLHYLGHARPDGLKLEMPNGLGRLVDGRNFATLLQQMPDLRLAVFAGCETARPPRDPGTMEWPGPLSVADHCVRDACPMVIGMQAVLPFGTERLFTRFFYQALTAGQPVAEALRLARLAIVDDRDSGAPLVNWSVPALFVGGSLPGPLTDPSARAEAAKRRSRVATRLDIRQRDLRFISRLTELREAIDVLSGRSKARLLHVIGLPGTGKSAFLDRAVEELDTDVAILSVSAARLLGEEDPLEELDRLVAELIRRAGRKPTPRRDLTSLQWWEEGLLEDLTDVPMALVIDDAHDLVAAGERADALLRALTRLTLRRSRVRLAVAAESELTALTTPLTTGEVRRIQLQALSWPEMWQWIRRNLPILTRFPETQLAGFYADLSHLEQWEQLADALTALQNPTVDDLPAVMENLAVTLSSSTSVPAAPPVFGEMGAEVTPPPQPSTGAEPAPRRILKVAIAGPHTVGREAQFSRAVTRFAAERWVSGRVVASESGDPASSLGELLTLSSPFKEGFASSEAIADWITQASAAAADLVVLDFGAPEPDQRITKAIEDLLAADRLVIAAGGVSAAPSHPAWLPGVLAIGALGDDGKPTAYSPFFPADQKPDVFAPMRVDEALMGTLLNDPTMQGTSMAALNATAMAIAVWATDRGLSGSEVRRVLVDSAARIPRDDRIPRVLDVDAALAMTRRQLLLDTLQNEPMELGQVLAETGLRPEVAVPIINELVEEGTLTRMRSRDAELIEDPNSLARQYEQLRQGAPGWERTVQLEKLVDRARQLARHGRYNPAKVVGLWSSGNDGRRVVALGVIQARPELGAAWMVAEGIRDSRSAFEQYHALQAALAMRSLLKPDDLEMIQHAAADVLHTGALDGSDRKGMAEQLAGPTE